VLDVVLAVFVLNYASDSEIVTMMSKNVVRYLKPEGKFVAVSMLIQEMNAALLRSILALLP
jgi:hypothetical protein